MNMPPLRQEAEKPKAPKNLKDYPAYLKELLGGFFSRLLYIYSLVWETRPWMLFVMLFMTVPALCTKKLRRYQGIVLLAVYAAYVAFQFFA